MPELEYHLVNSFSASSPTSGSQCAVVILPTSDPRLKKSDFCQSIATNFNFPATSFVSPRQPSVSETDEDELEYDVRWFAVGELPFCGHGTLGAAHTLFSLYPEARLIRFHAKPGVLLAKRQAEGVELSLPIIPLDERTKDKEDIIDKIAQVSSIRPEDVLELATFDYSGTGIIVELKPDVDLAGARIDGRGLSNTSARVIIFTQMSPDSSSELNIRSRVFLPDAAAVEDPATGSAHATLTGYYSTHPSPLSRLPGTVQRSNGGFAINATQMSARGGGMKARYADGRAIITAKVTTWARGTLSL